MIQCLYADIAINFVDGFFHIDVRLSDTISIPIKSPPVLTCLHFLCYKINLHDSLFDIRATFSRSRSFLYNWMFLHATAAASGFPVNVWP